MTEVKTDAANILFSYETPVACFDNVSCSYFRTAKKHSTTTSRHINKWLDGVRAEEMPQEYFNGLV
jgi:hypothetical protein